MVHVSTPACSHNSACAALQGDWRKLVKHAEGGKEGSGKEKKRKASSSSAAVAAAPKVYPTNSLSKPDLEALSVGLPAGWKARWDIKTGDIYYESSVTKVR